MTRCPEDSSADLAAELIDILPRLFRRLRADVPLHARESRDEPERKGLAEMRGATGQVALMNILVTQQRANMQELATLLAVTPASVTMMVRRLLAQGYVERARDERDWRQVWVSATERGRQVIRFYSQERQAVLNRRLAQLSQEECARLEAVLPVLRKLVDLEQ